jgi:hypothetical protein
MECVKQNYDAFKSNDFRNYWIVLSVASVLLVENTRVPGKKHRPAAGHCLYSATLYRTCLCYKNT